MHALNKKELINSELFSEEWYYKIELMPGLFTSGCEFDNIILTRKILKNIDVKGKNCLDIGAMECLHSILLKKQGAQYVHAFDRLDCEEKVKLVKAAHNVRFEYSRVPSLREFLPIAKNTEKFPYDVVVFSGVLYHMFDPLSGLAMVRGLLRNGGILLLETAAVIEKSMAMYFNAEGRFYQGTNFFMVTIECLDYILRFLRLKPLDCIYLKHHKDLRTARQVCRVCIPCLAVEKPLACQGDEWIKRPFIVDFGEYLNRNDLKSDKPAVSYKTDNKYLLKRSGIGSVNIFETVFNSPETPRDKDKVYLKLSDIY
jgi:2-polyprenyl-3-methyl-5-hydroxy-6-metoxy-1,4-benzoquinol methylase